MARKKKINKEDIFTFYMNYYLENGRAPGSAYELAKLNNFDEKDFFTFFGNLKSVEKSIFDSFYDQTLVLLQNSEDFEGFDVRNKLLSFYYTYFEILTANRSFVMALASKSSFKYDLLKLLSSTKRKFSFFIERLEIEKLDLKDTKLDRFIDRSIEESLWVQFVVCFKFWLDDESAALEKTDIFIEKSVNTGFDLLDVKPLRSILDLGKFLYHEKIHMN